MSATPIVCRTCLLEMELPEGMTVLTCPACGTENSRPQSSGLTLSVLQRATRQRLACDFAAAEISYQQVLMEHYDEHEALWGRLLCHYGVEYVEDPRSGKRLPTVHTVRRKPLRAQQDFADACSAAPDAVRAQYEAEAEYIDQVQDHIRILSQTCKPYDIFLCHKTTMPGTPHYTEDFARANQLYTELRLMGYRVFFAPVEIQSAAGASYEAAIYHALETSRVMLVVCSSKEYLNSPWVRSEWSRFLEMTTEQPDKRILPLLYGGMPHNQLPREFAIWHIQAVTMGEKDSWTHITSIIQDVAGTPEPPIHTTPESCFTTQPNGSGCTISAYHGTDTEVIIPEKIRGRKVISVPLGVFMSCDARVTSIHIPAGVTSVEAGIPDDDACLASIEVAQDNPFYEIRSNALFTHDGELICLPPAAQAAYYILPSGTRSVGNYAFSACRHLQSVTLPAGVTVIGSFAFDRCHSLTHVKLPLGLSVIGDCAFAECDALESLQLPAGLSAIGDNFLAGCTSLQEIRIPIGVQSVPNNAFADCTALREVIIAPSVTAIGASAFLNCTSLEKLYIPADVQTIDESALDGCTALQEIAVAPGNQHFVADSETLRTRSGCLLRFLPGLRLTAYAIPEDVTTLGDSAFADCACLEALTIPEHVRFIGENAFDGCSSLVVTTQSGSAAEAFAQAHGLSCLCTTPEELFETKSYKDGCMITGYKGGDGNLIIPPQIRGLKVLHLGDNAFTPGKDLHTNVIYEIGRHFDVVQLPETLINIFSTAFNGVSVGAYRVSSGNTVFMECDDVLFMKNGSKLVAYPNDHPAVSYTIPDGVTKISALAFHHCSSLLSVTIPEGVQAIESSIFYGCRSLRHVELPHGLEKISEVAFKACTALEELEIPRSVTEINPNAFKDCSNLTLLVHNGSGAHAFALQHGISCKIIGGADATSIPASEADFVTETSGGTCTITKYTGPGGEVCIPQMIHGKLVTAIGSRAFYGCNTLAGVTIPEGVAKIGSEAFDSCAALATVVFPEGLIELGSWAFRSCLKLQQVTLPSTLRRIDSFAFEYCHNLQQINLPDALETINFNAFSECTSLKEIRIPSRIRVIEEHTFRKCTALQKVILPEGLTAIESNAFYKCSSLREINLPNSITTFGTDVFSGCTQLAPEIRSRSRETIFGIRSFLGF